MDEDVDMDAPSISTLPEEKTPPPSRRKADSARKKKPKLSAPPVPFQLSWRKSGGQTSDGEPGEEGEPEDEEDQLIDDEDNITAPAPSMSAKTPDAALKKKTPAKRKARTEEDGGKKRTKKDGSSASKLRKPSGGSEATPSESFDDGTDMGTGANTPSISIVESEPQDMSSASKTAKKKSTPRKSAPKAAKLGKPSGCVYAALFSSQLSAKPEFIWQSQDGYSGLVRCYCRRDC